MPAPALPNIGDLIKTCYVDAGIVLVGKVTNIGLTKQPYEDELRIYFTVSKVISGMGYAIKVGEIKFVHPSELLEVIRV